MLKRLKTHKNKTTQSKTQNKSPRRTNHKATKSKTNPGTTALERPAEQTTGGFKAPHSQPTLPRDPTLLKQKHIKISARWKAPNPANASKRKHKKTNQSQRQTKASTHGQLHCKPEQTKTNSWTMAGQANVISSSPNPLVVEVLRRGRHWVWCIAINNDWVDN